MKVHPSQYQLVVQGLIEQHKPERCIVFMETKRKWRITILPNLHGF